MNTNMHILVGSHSYMTFVTTLFQFLFIPSQKLLTKVVFVVFLNTNINY